MNIQKFWPTTLLLTSLVAIPTFATDQNGAYNSNYSSWNDPTTETRKFVKELRQLVDKADDAKAADPKFLRDLRELAADYDKPLLKTLFSDDFSDGNFTHNLNWQVMDGKFWVDQHNGLRSRVEQQQVQTETEDPDNINDLLMGALLKELGKNKKKKQTRSEQPRYQPAAIRTDQRISNAFVMQVDLIPKHAQGRIDFVIYKDSRRLNGYRLIYTPNSHQVFQFLRLTERGETVIGSYRKPISLKNNQVHKLEWRRDRAGKMSLTLNNKLLFSATDSSLRSDFNGFAFINSGGDYALRQISLSEVY